MSPGDCAWKELRQEFMKTILQGKGTIHCTHYNLVHKFITMPSSDENTGSERSSGQRVGKF